MARSFIALNSLKNHFLDEHPLFGNFGVHHGFMVLTHKSELFEKRVPANSLVVIHHYCIIPFEIAMKGMG